MEILSPQDPLVSENTLRGVSGEVRYLAQFNKLSGEFITLHSWHENHALETIYSKYLDVKFDPETHGTNNKPYNEFAVVPLSELPVVITEEGMDGEAEEAILDAYSTGRQLNILAESLEAIARAVGVDVPELTEMREQIAEIREKNERRKRSYANSPEHEYISNDEAAKRLSRQMEGGRHEAIGPRLDNGI